MQQRRRTARHHVGTLATWFLTSATVAAISVPARALVPDVPSDFNGDGYADLAISTIYEPSEDGTPWVGGVNVLYGSDLGLSAEGDQLFTADTPGIAGSGRKDGFFGEYLMPGDFDGDGYDDLAVGAIGASVSGHARAGAVIVVYGSADGLAGTGSRESVQWTLASADVPGTPGHGDEMGYQLASGDTNADGFDELAVGIAERDIGPDEDAGAVLVLPGSATGLTGIGSELWHPLVAGVPGCRPRRPVRLGDPDGRSRWERLRRPGDRVSVRPGEPHEAGRHGHGALLDGGRPGNRWRPAMGREQRRHPLAGACVRSVRLRPRDRRLRRRRGATWRCGPRRHRSPRARRRRRLRAVRIELPSHGYRGAAMDGGHRRHRRPPRAQRCVSATLSRSGTWATARRPISRSGSSRTRWRVATRPARSGCSTARRVD